MKSAGSLRDDLSAGLHHVATSEQRRMNDNATTNGLKLASMAAFAVVGMVAIAGTLTYLGPLLAGLVGLQ
jgi:hypothetical protein